MIEVYSKDLVDETKKVKVDLRILGTGSTGNCIILNNEIVFDCGLSNFKDRFTSGVMNKNIVKMQLKTMFISHAHNDHCNGINQNLHKDFLNLKSVIYPLVYDKVGVLTPSQQKFIDTIPMQLKNKVPSNCKVLYRFDVKHDIANDGYIIWYKNKLIMYGTDIGDKDKVYVGYNYNALTNCYTFYNVADVMNNKDLFFKRFDLYLLECNHSKKILYENENKATNLGDKKYFHRSGLVHLDTDSCNLILSLIETKPVVLLHRSIVNLPLSKENYWFINDWNQNVKVAINEWEVENVKDKIAELHLITNWKLEI